MWHKPQLMTAVADLLFAAGAAALLVAAVVWAVRMPLTPIQEVVVSEELREIQRSDLERALAGRIRGNFFSVNLENVRDALEQLPWVRRAEVRRHWPARLEVKIEEQRAVARWGEDLTHWVNPYGEVFAAAAPQEGADKLPLLSGPNGTAEEVLRRYADCVGQLEKIGLKPAQLALSQRLAWVLRLENGLTIELGREQQKSPLSSRLKRLVEIYPVALANRQPAPQVVDMRYPNGLTLRVASAGHEK